MWLTVPDTLKNLLWEGPLEVSADEVVDRLEREWRAQGTKDSVHDIIRDLPTVSIGLPETWPLTQIYPHKKMPPTLRVKLDESDFYFVRMPCSFRPRSVKSRIVWARFLVNLLPDSARQQPTAYDLHPLGVMQEVKRNVKVSLSPSLKFQEVEVGVGNLEFGFEYPELQPIISATGAGEAKPMWDYSETKGIAVQGSKWMHMLVKTPKGFKPVRATLDLAADVEVQGFKIAMLAIRGREQSQDHLTVKLV